MRSDRKPVSFPVLAIAVAVATLAGLFSPVSAQPITQPAFPAVRAHLSTAGELRIVAFGSSSTEGVGASGRAATYPARLLEDLKQALPSVAVSVANRGIGGQDAEEFHARIAAVIAERPDLVIFQTGTNDPLRELPIDRFTTLTRADLSALRAAHIDVLLMEPQFCRVFAEKAGSFAYVEAIRSLGLEFGVPVVRRWDMMKDWLVRGVAPADQLQASDGLHMADRGYDLLARNVADVIVDDIRRSTVVAAR